MILISSGRPNVPGDEGAEHRSRLCFCFHRGLSSLKEIFI